MKFVKKIHKTKTKLGFLMDECTFRCSTKPFRYEKNGLVFWVLWESLGIGQACTYIDKYNILEIVVIIIGQNIKINLFYL